MIVERDVDAERRLAKELRELRKEFNAIVDDVRSRLSASVEIAGLSRSARDAKYREELQSGTTVGKRFHARLDSILNRICGLYISGAISKDDLESWSREINTAFN